MLKQFTITSSSKNEILNINDEVKKVVEESNIKEGICLVYTPHATCAVIINENYDPNIQTDLLRSLKELIPEGIWLHDKIDGNAAAHLKSSIIGPSESIIINNNQLVLGRWQDIMLVDFDGPRERKVLVKIVEG